MWVTMVGDSTSRIEPGLVSTWRRCLTRSDSLHGSRVNEEYVPRPLLLYNHDVFACVVTHDLNHHIRKGYY